MTSSRLTRVPAFHMGLLLFSGFQWPSAHFGTRSASDGVTGVLRWISADQQDYRARSLTGF